MLMRNIVLPSGMGRVCSVNTNDAGLCVSHAEEDTFALIENAKKLALNAEGLHCVLSTRGTKIRVLYAERALAFVNTRLSATIAFHVKGKVFARVEK
jgi:hypothetical protein